MGTRDPVGVFCKCLMVTSDTEPFLWPERREQERSYDIEKCSASVWRRNRGPSTAVNHLQILIREPMIRPDEMCIRVSQHLTQFRWDSFIHREQSVTGRSHHARQYAVDVFVSLFSPLSLYSALCLSVQLFVSLFSSLCLYSALCLSIQLFVSLFSSLPLFSERRGPCGCHSRMMRHSSRRWKLKMKRTSSC